MSLHAFVLDAWAALSFKRDQARRLHSSERSLAAPTWIGDHKPRIEAYTLLASYFSNVARFFIPVDAVNDDERRAHREYGDAALLVKAVRSAVLGDDQTIEVEGAEDDPGDEPTEPDDATPEQRADYELERAEWAERKSVADAANERQEWLRTWASPQVERFVSKMLETELDAQKLGDGVYVLGWSNTKRRVRLRLFDPGAYFPVIDPGMPEDEYPRKVHIAWSFTRKDADGKEVEFVRRLTWELAPIRSVGDEQPGTVTRQLPYAEEPTSETCYFSDGTWEVTEGRSVEDFTEGSARWEFDEELGTEVRELDLGIDFIPVVHLPNSVAIKEHFGEALITSLAQILDDLAAADTDAAKAADLVGVPMIGVSGVQVGDDVTVRPGALLKLGNEGKLSVVDLSNGLVALHGHIENLLDRLTTNARVPDAVLGRVEPQSVTSGLHMLLTFGPLRALVAEQRLVRDEKYPLLLKFVQRWAMVAGELPPGRPLDARVAFGSFLPNDRSGMIAEVVQLYAAKLISRSRALAMLAAGGVDLGEVADELIAVESEDFESALALLEATGDTKAVYEFLHRDQPETPEVEQVPPGQVLPPAIVLPGAPQPPPEQ